MPVCEWSASGRYCSCPARRVSVNHGSPPNCWNGSTEPHTRLRYLCSPQHTDSALYPVIGQMERAAGTTRAQAKLDKLDALLAQTSTSTQDAHLLAEMLSLPNNGRYAAFYLDWHSAGRER